MDWTESPGEEKNLSKFDLNLLAPLDVLLREKNVTVAADQLGVSQPTMSGMLNRLREHLNDPLLVRVGRSFELTPLGEEIASKVRQTLLNIDSLVVPKANFELNKAVRHIRIMASDVSLLLVAPYIFRNAEKEAPNLTFEVVPVDNPVQQVYQGNVDLCLTGDTIDYIEGGASNTVRTKILTSDVPVGVVDKTHPLSGTITFEQFMSYPYAAAQFPGANRTADDNIVIGLSQLHPPRVRVPSFMAIASTVSGTNMIGILPSRLLPLLPESWHLRTLRLPEDFGKLTLRALWHRRHDNDRVHKWLRATAQASCARSISQEVPEPGDEQNSGRAD